MTKNVNARAKTRTRKIPEQKPVSSVLFWLSMGVTAICVAAVMWMVIANVPTAKLGIWPRALIVALFVISVVSSLLVAEILPSKTNSWAEWRKPKVLGAIAGLIVAAAGLSAGISPLFAPDAASGAGQKRIEGKVDSIATEIGAGGMPEILKHIKGKWGEANCEVVRKFELKDRAISVSTLRVPLGMKRRDWGFTWDSDSAGANSLKRGGGMKESTLTTTERKGLSVGQTVIFRYRWDGANEVLVWDGQTEEQPAAELRRCR